jgi:trk system potassium uptake protein
MIPEYKIRVLPPAVRIVNNRFKIDTYKVVFKQIGILLKLLGYILFIPSVVSLIYFEWYSFIGFLLSGLIVLGVGFLLYYLFRKASEPHFNQAMIIAASGWLVFTFVGGLPFYLIAWISPAWVMQQFVPAGADYTSSLLFFRNYLHCFFESMSGYTTTGLTMAVHEPSVGNGILFYRSFTQWIGGAGFIVLALAVLKQTSGKSVQLLYGSESTGLRLETRVKETVRAIYKSYIYVTAFIIIYLIVGTLIILPGYPLSENIFNSVNHAMAGLSSGGFSTLDDSIASYNSPRMDYLYLLPMILGSFSLPFYFRIIFQRKFGEIWRDIQTRSLIMSFIFGSILLSLLLFYEGIVPNPVREGIFQFISAISTTGWQTSNIHSWDTRSIVFIVFAAMFIGGAWGGTVGGIKIIRARLIQKGMVWQIKKALLSPNAIKTIKFDGKIMLPDEMNRELATAATFSLMFLIILMGCTFITSFFIQGEYPLSQVLFESIAAQSTAGLSVGITGPSMNPVVEIIYIFQMWIGRLEIIPVLALFRVLFVRSKNRFF